MIFYSDKEWSALNSIRQAVESKVSHEVESLLVKAWDSIQTGAEARQARLFKQSQELAHMLETVNAKGPV
jgi:hypothetical protein